MKRASALALIVLLTLTAVAYGQESMQPGSSPAPELAKLQKMIGNWKGSGTSMGGPGSGRVKWTSRGTSKWILDGHFIQEETRVDIEGVEGAPAPPPLIFRSYYGWDASRNRYVGYGTSNMGQSDPFVELYWIDENTLVTVSQAAKNGVPTIERSVSKYADGKVTFHVETAVGTGDFVIYVEGTLAPTTESYEISPEEERIAFGAAPEAMTRLHGIAGTYAVDGEVIPMPGMESMKVHGRETIRPIFGGSILETTVESRPAEGQAVYEARSALVWLPERQCYVQFWLDNMGMSNVEECRWVGDRELVSTSTSLEYGAPHVQRATVKLGEDGSILEVSADRMTSTAKVPRAFFGSYKKLSDMEKKPEVSPKKGGGEE